MFVWQWKLGVHSWKHEKVEREIWRAASAGTGVGCFTISASRYGYTSNDFGLPMTGNVPRFPSIYFVAEICGTAVEYVKRGVKDFAGPIPPH